MTMIPVPLVEPAADRDGSGPLFSAVLAAAPHRLLFLAGAGNLLLAMLWWTAWLVDARWSLLGLPQPAVPAGWLHATVMQYLVLPPFFFGFLLTVFPRWMSLPALRRSHYVPVGAGLLGGQMLTLAGMLGATTLLHAGAVFTIVGWSIGLYWLLGLLWRARDTTWHAVSCAAALALGLVGFVLYATYLHVPDPRFMFASIKLGTFGLLLPVFVTVAHRMFPFFAGTVVVGYKGWRPLGWLAAFWVLALVHLALELRHAYGWLWLPDAALAVLTGAWLWRNWPRAAMPPLLLVLFLGSLWLPIAMSLYAAQSAWYASFGEFLLGRAPAHALFVGFFGSLLVAMVTRVTHGHSGRPLVLGGVAKFGFVAIQCVAVVRIAAEVLPDRPACQAVAAAGWLIAFAPWVVRSVRIYTTPRVDGMPG
jgi:uncharacterized protein involved in response to NO